MLSGYLSGVSSSGYGNVDMPKYAPPSYIFPIVWTILYTALGFIAYLIYNDAPTNIKLTFTVHMLINYAWTFVFFNLGLYSYAMLMIIVMILTLLYIKPWLADKSNLAKYLSYIYLAWLLYALFLNIMVVLQN